MPFGFAVGVLFDLCVCSFPVVSTLRQRQFSHALHSLAVIVFVLSRQVFANFLTTRLVGVCRVMKQSFNSQKVAPLRRNNPKIRRHTRILPRKLHTFFTYKYFAVKKGDDFLPTLCPLKNYGHSGHPRSIAHYEFVREARQFMSSYSHRLLSYLWYLPI